MAVYLSWEQTQGPRGDQNEWAFSGQQVREGSDVGVIFSQPLTHEVVLRLYQEAGLQVPATGLEVTNVTEHRNELEPLVLRELRIRGIQ